MVAGSALLAAGVATGLALPAAAQDAGTVGLTRLTLGGLPVTLVYPAQAAPALIRQGPFEIQVARDAPPAAGQRRLVLLSHGSGGSDMADHELAATLARAGFVVAQPLHAGDNFRDSSRAGTEAWQSRPTELLQVIDALATHPAWAPRLRLDAIGLHGMSAGGMGAMALAGARWSTLNLVRHCLAHGDDDLGFCYFGIADPEARAQRRARYERARDVPTLFLPSDLKTEHGGRAGAADPRPDARIAAVSLSVPVAAPLSADSLARVAIPVGVVSAGGDTLLLPAHHSDKLLRECTRCTRLAHLPAAGHFDLLAPWPADAAQAMVARQPRGGAPEAGFDAADRQRAFDAIAAFHLKHLGGALGTAVIATRAR
jgi:predicted dienelactone hydrolase